MNDLRDRVRTALSTIADAAPVPDDMPVTASTVQSDDAGRHRWVSIAACLIAVAGLTAAGLLIGFRSDAPSSPTSSAPAITAPATPDDEPGEHPVGREWRRTLPFVLTSSENEQLYTLWQARIADCAADRGFEYAPSVYYDDDATVNPLDLDAVRAFGYHLPSFIIETTRDDPNLDQIRDDPAFADATSDCANEAFAQTWGPDVDQLDFIAQHDALLNSFSLEIEGFEQTPEFTALAATWSTCMAERGYQYATPGDALLRYSDANSITRDEIDTRTADSDCDNAAGLTVAHSHWQAQRINAWLADNQAAIDQATAARDAFIDAAL